MEIYLIGHGGWKQGDGTFNPPPNVVLHFYCPHGKMFDSSWEEAVRSGNSVDHRDFLHERGGLGCYNYRLAHPGGIKSMVSYDKLHPLVDPYYVGSNLRDQLNCAVKDRTNNWYVHLEDVLKSVRPNGTVFHVHWFACRDILDGATEGGFETAAKDIYGGLYTGKPAKSAGKLDMSKVKLNLPF